MDLTVSGIGCTIAVQDLVQITMAIKGVKNATARKVAEKAAKI